MTKEQVKKMSKTITENEYNKLFLRYKLLNKECDKLFSLVKLFSSKYDAAVNEAKALDWYKEKCLDYKGLFGWIIMEKINWKIVKALNVSDKYYAMFKEYADRFHKMSADSEKEFNSASEIFDSKEYNNKLYRLVMTEIGLEARSLWVQ